jgi:hypothetical protein
MKTRGGTDDDDDDDVALLAPRLLPHVHCRPLSMSISAVAHLPALLVLP